MIYSLALAAVWVTSAFTSCLAEGDYFLLVRSWDPSVCEHRSCKDDIESRFTIHGLWPENYDGTWPQFCSQQPFSQSSVEDLLPVLRREWPSLFTKDASFWKHEWLKHGTCSETLCPLLNDEHAFFFAVLALNKMYDLNAAAKSAKVPLNKPITQEWLEEEFSKAFGHRLAVHCGYSKGATPSPVTEVWMCLDSQMQPFDCPSNIHRTCNSHILLPTISDSVSEDVPADAINPGEYVGPHRPSSTNSHATLHRVQSIHELVFGDVNGDM